MSTRTRIEPVLVEVSLRNAIARRLREHGVPEFDKIASQVVTDLTGEPVIAPPQGVPLQFTIAGVHLVWPRGLDTRIPSVHEREHINKALKTIGNNERMTDDDNVRVLRTCYQALWRKVVIQAEERIHEIGEPTPPTPIATWDARIQEPTEPVVTTSMLEGRNPVLEASVGDDGTVKVTPKKRTRKKVEPVVSTEDRLTSLQDTLADLRTSLEGTKS